MACVSEEVIQKFLQEALSSIESERLVAHFDKCSRCGSLLRDVCEEDALHDYRSAYQKRLEDPNPDFSLSDSFVYQLYSFRRGSVGTEQFGQNETTYQSAVAHPSRILREKLRKRKNVSAENESLSNFLRSPESHLPQCIGRFDIIKRLGVGRFGVVLLANDCELRRHVALKLPNIDPLGSSGRSQSIVNEARKAAELEHPRIVRIYDVGLEGSVPYIVQQYIEGADLSRWVDSDRRTIDEVVALAIGVCQGVAHAHQHGFIHRDLKPENILVDQLGQPYVADFGLALHRDVQSKYRGEFAGTIPYMSPEQVRGLSHRVDVRSDIWSLGVVLYELLARCRPFDANDQKSLIQQIKFEAHRPLRFANRALPAFLERVCDRCLRKRPHERYADVSQLIEDLNQWLELETTSRIRPQENYKDIAVVPKGLRSFDASDSDFFLALLAGPRDRTGVPESVRFWREKIENRDGLHTFPIGVIYGPSGCGKSSMVKAGLLPRLSSNTAVIHVDVASVGTELLILKGLRRRFPELENIENLVDAMIWLREHQTDPIATTKTLLVLDQFEQWLHSHANQADSLLVEALRHCDGEYLQCLILVRDDFWSSISRIMHELGTPLIEGENSSMVDLFDKEHARYVLSLFGHAYGKLSIDELTHEQAQFLRMAVSDDHLATDGRIISVQLSLFAEMMKRRVWTTSELRKVRGSQGLGVAFLEEVFSDSSATPACRKHQQAARKVLAALLPERGGDIKGQMKSYEELASHASYAGRLDEMDELLNTLDKELRLITPTETGGITAQDSGALTSKYYQLTHDYLVQPLREWITQRQRETRSGRALLKLEERVSQWVHTKSKRFLPSPYEYVSICRGVSRQAWTASQREMMRVADRYYTFRLAVFIAISTCLVLIAHTIWQTSTKQSADARIDALLDVHAGAVPLAIEQLRPYRKYAVSRLRDLAKHELGVRRIRAACGLAAFGEVDIEVLLKGILNLREDESANITDAMRQNRAAACKALRRQFEIESDQTIRTRIVSTSLGLGEMSLGRQVLALDADPTDRTEFICQFFTWRCDLKEISSVMQEASEPEIRSALCLSIGNISPHSLRTPVRQTLVDALSMLYTSDSAGGVHSAAWWALRQWNVALPEVRRSAYAPVNQGWFENNQGMTMIQIPEQRRSEKADRLAVGDTTGLRIFMCDREIWVDLFSRFIDDPDPTIVKPTRVDHQRNWEGRGPINQVSWLDAVLFCNWLSIREGREPCYEVEEHSSWLTRHVEVKRCDFSLDGYRLPIPEEWEHACRSNSATDYSFGNLEHRFERFGIFQENITGGRAADGGTKMPNGWGFFDMHGNLAELCRDAGMKENPIVRGGSFTVNQKGCYSGATTSCPSLRAQRYVYGFRVVCGEKRQVSESE